MRCSIFSAFLALCTVTSASFAVTPISQLRKNKPPKLTKRHTDLRRLYPEYTLSVPVDHFHNDSKYAPHSDDYFPLRYYFDAQYYEPGGPVILLAGGETGADDRLPFLQTGILQKIAKATNGVGVILEHRYYGTSFPTPDLSTENLRFLTTEQALADTAYFAQNVRFKGLEHLGANLTAPNTAYIAYGGSYAGAFVAFLRKTYPDIFYGAISSSGVTQAIWDYWTYYSPIAEYGDSVGGTGCVENTRKLTNLIDRILQNNTQYIPRLQALFGLQDIKHPQDFANVLTNGISGWQNRNWDPTVDDPTFKLYCSNITAKSPLYPTPANLTSEATHLIHLANYTQELPKLLTPLLNYISYINLTVIAPIRGTGQTLDQAYSTFDTSFYTTDDIRNGSWRSWPYQYCTQWGFLATGSGVPANQLPLLSRTLDLKYQSNVCREAFNLSAPADTTAINDRYGGYNISYSRLAIIDGREDPWRGATPHAPLHPFEAPGVVLNPNGGQRTDTPDEPFVLIETDGGAVHHWDENGLVGNQVGVPANISAVQEKELEFVQLWMKGWNPPGLVASD